MSSCLTLVCADFFELAANPESGFDHDAPARRFDAILLDIDHSPEHWLSAASEGFYSTHGLEVLAQHLRPHGVFGLWSNDGADERFTARLENVFNDVRPSMVSFDNPYSGGKSSCTIYVARDALKPGSGD